MHSCVDQYHLALLEETSTIVKGEMASLHEYFWLKMKHGHNYMLLII